MNRYGIVPTCHGYNVVEYVVNDDGTNFLTIEIAKNLDLEAAEVSVTILEEADYYDANPVNEFDEFQRFV